MTGMLAAALALAKSGCAVFPCIPATKTPATPHGCKDASKDPTEISRMWARAGTNANVGLAAGLSNLVVVDLDGPKGTWNWKQLAAANPTPRTLTAETPGGYHLYYRPVAGRTVRNSVSKVAGGIDIRAAVGYVIAPPSQVDPEYDNEGRLEKPGGSYRWLPGPPVVAALPAWLIERLNPPVTQQSAARFAAPAGTRRASGNRRLAAILDRLAEAPHGQRNGFLYWAASRVAEMHRDGDLCDLAGDVRLLQEAGRRLGLTDLEIGDEIDGTIGSGLRGPKSEAA